jgi:dTDP-4-dehydrorhamnose reductase
VTIRALVFGASGQVGNALLRTAPHGVVTVAHDSRSVDIRDRDAVVGAIEGARPDVVINCAAFTAVDDAETRTDDAFAVNGVAPGMIAELSASVGARFIHLSTDYVFDGASHIPYALDAVTAPINAYGASKLEGEHRVLSAAASSAVIVRTAWVHSATGTNFIKTAVTRLRAGLSMRVVDDQIGTPTRAMHLAEALWHITERPTLHGLLHFTDAGVASWLDVAVAVHDTLRESKQLGEGACVLPASSDEFPRPARRPQFSVLDKHASWRSIDYVPVHWRTGVVASTMELLNA